MKTIINVSSVTDYSGEPPVTVDSNPVTTVINQPNPQPVITRFFHNCCECCSCDCSCCSCDCD